MQRSTTLLAAGLLALACQVGLVAQPPIREHPVLPLVLFAGAFAAYAVAVRHVLAGRSAPLGLVLVLALAMRLVALGGTPSDDVNRYLWEGRVQQAGENPYVLAPTHPRLAALAESAPEHAAINHPEWTAIYPPLMLLWHRAVVGIVPTALAMKLSFLLAELVLLLGLLQLLRQRGQAPTRVLLYAWNPLAVFAVAFEGHHDVVAAAALVLGLVFVSRLAPVRATLALTAAVLTKGFALAALPALVRTPRERSAAPPVSSAAMALVAGLALAAACCAPFLDAGAGLGASLERFGNELHYNDSLHALLSALLGPGLSRAAAALLWLMLAAWVMTRGRPDPVHRVAVLLAGLLALLPTLHPWYLMTLLPLLCVYPWWGWLALSGTVALTWLPHLEIARSGQWVEWHALRVPEYLPLYAWMAWKAARAARAGQGAG